jgi:hydroxyacylglutathione hydrolase
VAIGLRRFAGYLHGGMTSWRQEKREARRTERIAAADLPARAVDDPGLQIVDVRERSEWEAGHIPGSVSAPWHDIDAIPAGIDGDRPIAVICASGSRAGVAASLLLGLGATAVIHVVDGGVGQWDAPGRPLTVAASEPAQPLS